MTSTADQDPATVTTASTARTRPGTVRFGDLNILFDNRVLRPRSWTAAQSRWAAELLDMAPPGPVLELCAGAGQIGLLAIAGTGRHLVAVDASAVACAFTRINADAAGLGEQVEVREATLEHALEDGELFPVIIADPPWVPTHRIGDHPEDPVLAIDGGGDGLAVALVCVEIARRHLAPNGVMLLQLGSDAQADALGVLIAQDAPGLVVEEVRRPDPSGLVICVRRTG